jgi:GTPase SAR1 family protein
MASKVDLKVVLLGTAMSGKTSLVERYVYERFTGNNQSVRVSVCSRLGAGARALTGGCVRARACTHTDGRGGVWGQDHPGGAAHGDHGHLGTSARMLARVCVCVHEPLHACVCVVGA